MRLQAREERQGVVPLHGLPVLVVDELLESVDVELHADLLTNGEVGTKQDMRGRRQLAQAPEHGRVGRERGVVVETLQLRARVGEGVAHQALEGLRRGGRDLTSLRAPDEREDLRASRIRSCTYGMVPPA